MKKFVFSVTLGLVALLLAEGTLGLLARVSPRIRVLLAPPMSVVKDVPPARPDDRLVIRPSAEYPDHDRNGFRNPSVPDRARIVALGDSHTYGTGVTRGDAWPQQLAAVTGVTVYQMAFGGYGPVHSLALWEEAVALQPEIIIEAFYSGNDLYDGFDMSYTKGKHPELMDPDPEVQARLTGIETASPLAKRAEQMETMFGASAVDTAVAEEGFSPRGLLSDHSRLYGLLRRVRYEIKQRAGASTRADREWENALALGRTYPEYFDVFDDGRFRTVFNVGYRLTALELGDPRVAEGLQVCLRAMRTMNERAAARHTRFLVVMVPTKEAAFRKVWTRDTDDYRRIATAEDSVRTVAMAYFEHNGIEYLDLRPVMQRELEAGVQPYPETRDGHPNPAGHRAIAVAVAAYLGLASETDR